MYSNNHIDSDTINAALAIIFGLLALLLVVSLVFYILGSIGLMKIAKKNGIKHSWFAWVPGFSTYLIGELAFKTQLKAALFLAITLVLFTVSFIVPSTNSNNSILSWLSMMCGAILLIISLIAYYKIYKKMSTNAVTMLVFTILAGSLLAPVFFFAIRNNDVINDA